MASIISLNVGGTRFSTSKETLLWIPDTFFTALLNGEIPSLTDDTGAIFIDRDPEVFSVILNYLRSGSLRLNKVDLHSLIDEVQFYSIGPLLKRLNLCDELKISSCGNILFDGFLASPTSPNISLPVRQVAEKVNESTLPLSLDMHSSDNETLSNLKNFKKVEKKQSDDHRVQIIKAHQNVLAVCYSHFFVCYKLKDSIGWQPIFNSPHIDNKIDLIAVNGYTKHVVIAFNAMLKLWSINDIGLSSLIGTFDLCVRIEYLFFIGNQMIAMSSTGKIGVWRHVHWQTQNVQPILSFDAAGSFLVLGCNNGSICLTDMQKFPLRIKDNDLLITEVYKDPMNEPITAISVYLTPKTTNLIGNWLEIAYGTVSGCVRVIVQHPETVGSGPQLFQMFTVHQSAISKVTLSEKYLFSVCSEYTHVRTWRVTRFRGMISTQPGLTPEASFKIVSLESRDTSSTFEYSNHITCGPFGEQYDEQIFVQKVVPQTNKLFIRSAVNGKRICVIQSIDDSVISSYFVYEFDGSNRFGTRPKRLIFTGHSNGTIQMWDLTTAFDLFAKNEKVDNSIGGPDAEELIELLEACDITNSRDRTPSMSPTESVVNVPK